MTDVQPRELTQDSDDLPPAVSGTVTAMNTGTAAAEMEELRRSIEDHAAGGRSVDRVVVATCPCGGETFSLLFDDEVGVAARVCTRCGAEYGIADSDEHLDDVDEVLTAECTCGHDEFRVATGFALDEAGEVRWVSVGLRCTRDGIAGVYVDWKIDYLPSAHLLDNG